MSRESYAADIARSYLPEWYLIKRRHIWALRHKYEERYHLQSRTESRLKIIRDLDEWEPWPTESTKEYQKKKYLGGVMVAGRMQSTFTAHDPQDPTVRIRAGKKDATELHIVKFAGLGHLREQLAKAAEYVEAHKPLRRTKYIAGSTYPAMGRLATRLGFRSMVVEDMYESELDSALGLHLAYCAINGQHERVREFTPAVVYLPTDEFIERFGMSENTGKANAVSMA